MLPFIWLLFEASLQKREYAIAVLTLKMSKL